MKHRKVWSALLAVLLLATILPVAQPVKASIAPRYNYGILDEGFEIFGVDKPVTGDVTIPATLDGWPVIAVGFGGFSERADLTSVVLSDGIRYVDDYAFSGCENLASATLPDSLQWLGYGTFDNCPKLEYNIYGNGKYLGNGENPYLALIAPVSDTEAVTVHKDTKLIDKKMASYEIKLRVEAGNPHLYADDAGVLFSGDKTVLYWAPKHLSGSYTVPEGVETIRDNGFTGCKSLTDVTVADSVKTIGSYAFSGCSALKTVSLGNQLEQVGESAFSTYEALEFNSYENGKYLGNAANPYLLLVDVEDEAAAQFTFHENTKVIGYNAFLRCGSLTELTVPEGIVGISDRAFSSCGALTKLTVGKAVRTIGSQLTIGCNQLAQIIVDSNNPYFSSHEGVILNKDQTVLVQAPVGITESYTLPDSVTQIEAEAFYDCKKLSGIRFGQGLREIGNNAFYNCASLTELTVPGTVETIAHYTFYQCNLLTAVTLEEGVKTVGSNAFGCCAALTALTLPDSLTAIGQQAFSGCSKLTEVTVPKGVARIGADVFDSCTSLAQIIVAQENPVFSSYGGVLYNKEMTRLIQAPDNIDHCVIPQSVQTIGEYAFYGCKKLEQVILPDRVTTIERGAFCDSRLAVLLIPASVTVIEGRAFDEKAKHVRFLGDVPEVVGEWEAIVNNGVYGSKNHVYYPADNATWTDAAKQRICSSAEWAVCKELAMLQGADSVITPENLTVTLEAEEGSNYFIGLYLDGKWVAPENYMLSESMALTIHEDYLATLTSGVHQLTLEYVDARARTTLTFQKNLVGDLDGANDVTEDDAIYLLQHVLMPDLFPATQDADFNKSGNVDEEDAIYLLQYLLMPDLFPLS